MPETTIEKIKPIYIDEVLKIQQENNLSPWRRQDYFDEIIREDSFFWVAKSENTIKGFAVSRLITTDSPPVRNVISFSSEIEIYNIAVEKNSHCKGIGTQILGKIIENGKKRNISSIWLEVRVSNLAAISFYKKNNFSEIYRRKNFYNYPPEDASVMKLDLTDQN